VARTIVHSRRASTERTPVGAGERRQKKISVIVPVSEAVLDWLVSKKHLAAKERENDAAIKHAIESLLSASAKSAALWCNHGDPFLLETKVRQKLAGLWPLHWLHHESNDLGDILPAQGDVLYLALEDSKRRLQRRMSKLLPGGSPWPRHLTLTTEWRRLHEGGLDDIRAWHATLKAPAGSPS
jgi:hypothetical protein